MTIRYCPSCSRNVQVVREELDPGLAIFLFCCTTGIGFFIYLFIYFLQPEDRCIICHSKTSMPLNKPNSQNSFQMQYTNPEIQSQTEVKQKKKEQEVGTYKKKILEPPLQEIYDIKPYIDETTGEISSEKKRFCPLCGQEHSFNQKFCPSCGGELRDE